ncbi:HET-domain-containing protein [Lophiostoma macrostomum CBS 122681]|uniref:HET-domain-containing protein n=1 Tax=Lophiostoma macrostomum CBS 122681 TaxID=1314788 RepID=A0A6A6SSP0_9PLEO|nr:HET-domain-containing protein [Lophiostoma macrostomum CBS 122681]
MWLLDVESLQLKEFQGSNIPEYAILSHTWGAEEVSFVEMKKPKYRETAERKEGFSKIKLCCLQAQKDGYKWAWVDSCCIDKRSSAELSEAINSMFAWYKLARRCYVYLSDVPSEGDVVEMLRKSRWFTRGFTLQELLAPRQIVFFAQDWVAIGYKMSLRGAGSSLSMDMVPEIDKLPCIDFMDELSSITRIPESYLTGRRGLGQACIAQRMYWASYRETTRAEDRAYSLMGLFDISMPVLYGEGLDKAFTRLQHQIILQSPDQTFLAWYRSDETSYRLLADSPDCFRNSGTVVRLEQNALDTGMRRSAFTMTNLGLGITLPLATETFGLGQTTDAALNCVASDHDGVARRIGLSLSFLHNESEGHPVFLAQRPRMWVFNVGAGNPTGMLICGNDYGSGFWDNTSRPSLVAESGIATRVLEICAIELGISSDMLVEEMNFAELGADSLMLLTIRARVYEEMEISLSPLDFHKHPTIGSFRSYLASDRFTKASVT